MPTEQEVEIAQLKAELKRLNKILNTPLYDDFLEAVKAEASHQASRAQEYHDEEKKPADWFWLIGYLAGKALAAHITGRRRLAMHHTISSAGVLYHWHQAIKQQTDPTTTPAQETPPP